MKKILIIGASGFIGSHIYEFFKKKTDFEIIGTYFKKMNDNFIHLDYYKKSSFLKKLNSIKPDIIIWSAGEKKLSVTESQNFNHKLNVEPLETLINFIRQQSIKKSYFIFISSDHVFSGLKGNYSNQETPDPVNNYGLSKYNSEKLIKQKISNYSIIRVGGVVGKGGAFFDWILNEIANNNNLKLFNYYFSPTPVEALCEAIHICILKNLKGIFHVSGNKRISKFHFGLQLKKTLKNSRSKLIETELTNEKVIDRSLQISEEFKGVKDLNLFFKHLEND